MRYKLDKDVVSDNKLLTQFLDCPSEITESALNELVQLEYRDTIIPRRRCNLGAFLCIIGLVPHLKILGKIALTDLQAMIRENHYSAFVRAIENGHLEVLEYLETLLPEDEIQLIFEAIEAFILAAGNGHLEILEHLVVKCSEKLQDMIKEHHYEAFRKAAENGHLNVLEYLAKLAPDYLQAMISANKYDAFMRAACNGHLECLSYLDENILDASRQAMFNAVDKRTYEIVAEKGHLPVLKYLRKNNCYLLPDCIAISTIAGNGHLSVLEYFAKLDERMFLAILISACEYAFSGAAKNGHLEVLKYLVKKFPGQFQAMINYDTYGAFRHAAFHGHIRVLEYLEERVTPEIFQTMILADDYFAFRQAAGSGYVEVLKYLAKKAPTHLQVMIMGGNRTLFSSSFKHVEVMRYLAEMVEVQSERDAVKIIDECIFAKDVESVGILFSKAPKHLKLNLLGQNFAFNRIYVLKEAFIKYGIPEGMTVNDEALNQLILAIRHTTPLLFLLCQATNEAASDLKVFSLDIIDYILGKLIRLHSFDSNETYLLSHLPKISYGFFKHGHGDGPCFELCTMSQI